MPKKIAYSPKDFLINADIYRYFLKSKRDDGWTKEDKFENFEYLVKIEEFANTSLNYASCLDVGCGTGDLSLFLEKYNIKEYLGIDIFEGSINVALEKYPKQNFLQGDFLSYPFKNTFDFVFCSGGLTTKLNTDNYQIMEAWIKKMWQLADKGLAFNLLIEQFDNQNFGTLFLYRIDDVLNVCKRLKPKPKIETVITPAGAGDTLYEMHVYLFLKI